MLDDLGLVGWPKTSGSRGIHINVRIEPRWTFAEVRRAALALAREVERRAPTLATSKWWKEERHGVFLDYNQNAKDRTVASAYSVRPTPDARVSMPLRWDEVADVEADRLHARHRAGAVRRATATRPPASTTRSGSLEALLELSARHEAEGLGDAPWPPNYRKQEGEPPRVQPSRQQRPDADYNTPEAEAEREKARAAIEQRFALVRGAAARSAQAAADADRPALVDPRDRDRTGRQEGRGAGRPGALEGAPPDAAAALEPADVLVDAMRGRSTTWTRIRVNLTRARGERPAQEPLEADYDPWAEYEWPDRSASWSGRRGRRQDRPRTEVLV